MSISAFQVIRRPIITEKGLGVKETQHTVVFEVATGATKTQIREAVQKKDGSPPRTLVAGFENMHGERVHVLDRARANARRQRAIAVRRQARFHSDIFPMNFTTAETIAGGGIPRKPRLTYRFAWSARVV